MERFNLTDGRVLELNPDYFADNPREWDNITKMICFHSRYNVGDKHEYNHSNYNGWDELQNDIVNRENPAAMLPLYMYDHGGVSISTSPFSCPWDSGQIGFVLISKDKARESLNVKRITKKIADRLEKCLLNEVITYNQYMQGNVYHFTIYDKDGDIEDSCSGFYGDDIQNNGIFDYLSVEDVEQIKKQL